MKSSTTMLTILLNLFDDLWSHYTQVLYKAYCMCVTWTNVCVTWHTAFVCCKLTPCVWCGQLHKMVAYCMCMTWLTACVLHSWLHVYDRLHVYGMVYQDMAYRICMTWSTACVWYTQLNVCDMVHSMWHIQYCSTADSMCNVADCTLYGILKTTYGKSCLCIIQSLWVKLKKQWHFATVTKCKKKQLQSEKHVVIVSGSQFTLVHSLQQQWLAWRRRRRRRWRKGWGQGNLWCLILALSHSATASPSLHYIVGLITSSLKLVWITVCERNSWEYSVH